MSRDLALSRTARLVNRVFFDSKADDSKVGQGLAAATARLVADRESLAHASGQAALIGTFQLVARMGISIELDVPDVPLIYSVAPLRKPTLRAALLDLGDHLIPGSVVRTDRGAAAVTLVFGKAAREESDAIYVSAGEFDCHLTRERPDPPTPGGTGPLGAFAAAAAAAAIVLDQALPGVESTTGTTRSRRPRPSPGPPVQVDLRKLFPNIQESRVATGDTTLALGGLDAVSGGAIINALISTLLQLPNVTGALRVIESDSADLSNVNRYMQLRADEDGRSKIDVLCSSSTSSLHITGVHERFTEETRERLRPLSEIVFVGVDDIPARWLVQREWPAALYVGATNDHEALVTTHHPGDPCVGCAHPDPLTAGDEFIPTISFVSFWAGLLQACALLAELTEGPAARRYTVFPFALGGKRWYDRTELVANERCPVGCQRPLKEAA